MHRVAIRMSSVCNEDRFGMWVSNWSRQTWGLFFIWWCSYTFRRHLGANLTINVSNNSKITSKSHITDGRGQARTETTDMYWLNNEQVISIQTCVTELRDALVNTRHADIYIMTNRKLWFEWDFRVSCASNVAVLLTKHVFANNIFQNFR